MCTSVRPGSRTPTPAIGGRSPVWAWIMGCGTTASSPSTCTWARIYTTRGKPPRSMSTPPRPARRGWTSRVTTVTGIPRGHRPEPLALGESRRPRYRRQQRHPGLQRGGQGLRRQCQSELRSHHVHHVADPACCRASNAGARASLGLPFRTVRIFADTVTVQSLLVRPSRCACRTCRPRIWWYSSHNQALPAKLADPRHHRQRREADLCGAQFGTIYSHDVDRPGGYRRRRSGLDRDELADRSLVTLVATPAVW